MSAHIFPTSDGRTTSATQIASSVLHGGKRPACPLSRRENALVNPAHSEKKKKRERDSMTFKRDAGTIDHHP